MDSNREGGSRQGSSLQTTFLTFTAESHQMMIEVGKFRNSRICILFWDTEVTIGEQKTQLKVVCLWIKDGGVGQGFLLSVRCPSILFDLVTMHMHCFKNDKNWGTGKGERKAMARFMK